MIHSREQLLHLVPEFTVLPAETEWLEFKVNNTDPEMIGERVSALANSARIAGREFGYLIWGVEDGSHKIVGTDFEPAVARKGNEPLEAWLARMVHPQVHFEFETVQVKSTRLVVLTIEPASFEPVKFGATAYVRVGPTTRELSKHPDRDYRRTPSSPSWTTPPTSTYSANRCQIIAAASSTRSPPTISSRGWRARDGA